MIWRAFAGSVLLALAFMKAPGMACQAAALIETRCRRAGEWRRWRPADRSRSSRLRCFVHFFVTPVMASITALDIRWNQSALAAVGVLDARAGDMQDQDYRVDGVGPRAGQDRVQARAELAQFAERVDDAGRPVDAGDQATLPRIGTPRERGLDDPGNIVLDLRHAAIVEGLHLAAGGGEPLPKMLLADAAEHRWLDGRGVRLHGGEQLLDLAAVEPVAPDQGGERRARQSGLVEHALLLGGAAEAAELGHQLAHGAPAAAVGVVRDVAADQPLEVRCGVPVRRGGLRRLPLAPCRVGCFDRGPLAEPVERKRQVRVQPRVVRRDL